MVDRSRPTPAKADVEELDRGSRARREADLRLSMSERLAKLHELCKQMSDVAGSAKRG